MSLSDLYTEAFKELPVQPEYVHLPQTAASAEGLMSSGLASGSSSSASLNSLNRESSPQNVSLACTATCTTYLMPCSDIKEEELRHKFANPPMASAFPHCSASSECILKVTHPHLYGASGMSDSGEDSVELEPDVARLLQQGGSDSGISEVELSQQPQLVITEEPQSRGFRFRYDSEGASHGGLQGINSSKDSKTYPTVQIRNYRGPARIAVSLVTNKDPPQPHVHELFGKNCENGTCVVSLKENPEMKAVFANLGVSHIKKRNVQAVLTTRIQNNMLQAKLLTQPNMDNPLLVLTDEEKSRAKKEAAELGKDMLLNVVRLCFRAYLLDQNGMYTRVLPPVYSKPIHDSKSPGAAALKICRMDKHAGSCMGNDEVFLLCDKVQKDDITVRFYEQDVSGMVKWEDYANFGPADVHRQYAIVFKTPAYHDKNILEPVRVYVQLKRLSDHETSESKTFTYYPQELDAEQVNRKKKKVPTATLR